jgi:hypothetical protein
LKIGEGLNSSLTYISDSIGFRQKGRKSSSNGVATRGWLGMETLEVYNTFQRDTAGDDVKVE